MTRWLADNRKVLCRRGLSILHLATLSTALPPFEFAAGLEPMIAASADSETCALGAACPGAASRTCCGRHSDSLGPWPAGGGCSWARWWPRARTCRGQGSLSSRRSSSLLALAELKSPARAAPPREFVHDDGPVRRAVLAPLPGRSPSPSQGVGLVSWALRLPKLGAPAQARLEELQAAHQTPVLIPALKYATPAIIRRILREDSPDSCSGSSVFLISWCDGHSVS